MSAFFDQKLRSEEETLKKNIVEINEKTMQTVERNLNEGLIP